METPTGLELPVSFTIAPARWRDLRAVAIVQKESFRPGLAYGLGALAMLRLMPGVTFLVAYDNDGILAGCVIADRDQGDLRILNIAVAPFARRRGVATLLLRTVASEHPEGDIVLMAEAHNRGALSFYESEGFVRLGVEPNYYGTGRDGIRMRQSRVHGSNRNGAD